MRTLTPVRRGLEEPLFHLGDPVGHVYLVVSGLVTLYLATEQGNEIEVGECGAGALVGLEALVATTYDTDARVTRTALLYCIPPAALRTAVSESSDVWLQLLQATLHRLSQTRNHMLDLAGRCARERLVLALLRSAVVSEGRHHVILPWGSKRRLAHHIGIKQETLSRVLQELAEARLIRTVPGGIELLDVTRLRGIAESSDPDSQRTAVRTGSPDS